MEMARKMTANCFKFLPSYCLLLLLLVGMFAPGIACAALSNTPDSPRLPTVDGMITAMVQHGNRIYIAGHFNHVGGEPRYKLAALDAVTGEVDKAWAPDVSNEIRSMIVVDDRLYVGGFPQSVRESSGAWVRHSVACFPLADGQNKGDADSWNPLLRASSSPYKDFVIESLAAYGDELIIGGHFDAGETTAPHHNLVAVKKAGLAHAGQIDLSWKPEPECGPNGWIRSLLVVQDTLYLSKFIDSTYYEAHSELIFPRPLEAYALGGDGFSNQPDPAWRPPFENDLSRVEALYAYNSRLYVSGRFCTARGSAPFVGLTCLNLADGRSNAVLDPDWRPVVDGSVRAMAAVDHKLVIGGSFDHVNGAPRRNLAAIELAGQGVQGLVDPAWAPDPILSTDPTLGACMLFSIIKSGSGCLVGGAFDRMSAQEINSYAGFGSTVPVRLSSFTIE